MTGNVDSHFYGNYIKGGGGNDPSKTRFHGAGRKGSGNDRREKRIMHT